MRVVYLGIVDGKYVLRLTSDDGETFDSFCDTEEEAKEIVRDVESGQEPSLVSSCPKECCQEATTETEQACPDGTPPASRPMGTFGNPFCGAKVEIIRTTGAKMSSDTDPHHHSAPVVQQQSRCIEIPFQPRHYNSLPPANYSSDPTEGVSQVRVQVNELSENSDTNPAEDTPTEAASSLQSPQAQLENATPTVEDSEASGEERKTTSEEDPTQLAQPASTAVATTLKKKQSKSRRTKNKGNLSTKIGSPDSKKPDKMKEVSGDMDRHSQAHSVSQRGKTLSSNKPKKSHKSKPSQPLKTFTGSCEHRSSLVKNRAVNSRERENAVNHQHEASQGKKGTKISLHGCKGRGPGKSIKDKSLKTAATSNRPYVQPLYDQCKASKREKETKHSLLEHKGGASEESRWKSSKDKSLRTAANSNQPEGESLLSQADGATSKAKNLHTHTSAKSCKKKPQQNNTLRRAKPNRRQSFLHRGGGLLSCETKQESDECDCFRGGGRKNDQPASNDTPPETTEESENDEEVRLEPITHTQDSGYSSLPPSGPVEEETRVHSENSELVIIKRDAAALHQVTLPSSKSTWRIPNPRAEHKVSPNDSFGLASSDPPGELVFQVPPTPTPKALGSKEKVSSSPSLQSSRRKERESTTNTVPQHSPSREEERSEEGEENEPQPHEEKSPDAVCNQEMVLNHTSYNMNVASFSPFTINAPTAPSIEVEESAIPDCKPFIAVVEPPPTDSCILDDSYDPTLDLFSESEDEDHSDFAEVGNIEPPCLSEVGYVKLFKSNGGDDDDDENS